MKYNIANHKGSTVMTESSDTPNTDSELNQIITDICAGTESMPCSKDRLCEFCLKDKERLLALIATERQKAVGEFLEEAGRLSVSTKYIKDSPLQDGKHYRTVGLALLKKLAAQSKKGEQE